MNVAPKHFGLSSRMSGRDWRQVADSLAWDTALAQLGGHPLQSALWGDARRGADGIEDLKFELVESGSPVLMARMELRRVPLLGGHVGWMPRGPACSGMSLDGKLLEGLARAADMNLCLLVTDLWKETESSGAVHPRRPETVWIDLAAGRDKLWRALDKRVRYDVGKASRDGVVVEQSRSPEDQEFFLGLMGRIGTQKGFDISLSRTALRQLLDVEAERPVGAFLFVARSRGAFAGAALVFKCGRTLHYFFGGTDRRHAKERIGESLHWSIIEWGIVQGATLYDLESIDKIRNPGTYAFKKKLGGREVAIAGKEYYPVSGWGSFVAVADRCRDRLRMRAP